MLGNDVVDLKLAKIQSNWQRKNYLSKVFLPAEQQFIRDSNQPDCVVWLMWSMKESVYKIVNRNTGHRSFNPLAFQCSFNLFAAHAIGSVNYSGETFSTYSDITQASIHTLGYQSPASFENCKIIQTENHAGYASNFDKMYPALSLQKDKSGLPEIYMESTRSTHIASVSHHGRFLYLAYLL